MTPLERTTLVLSGLNDTIAAFDAGDHTTHTRICYTVRWLNQNLDAAIVSDIIDDLDLEYSATIKSLLSEPYLRPSCDS